ncbi:MAG: hypothetical protein M3381_07120 [Actinomycetota bacterium]|nr:hypothetical protein [Actinomycetota bacterium]
MRNVIGIRDLSGHAGSARAAVVVLARAPEARAERDAEPDFEPGAEPGGRPQIVPPVPAPR